MDKSIVEKKIEAELKKREKSVRNKNAIEKLLGLFPALDALYGVLVGSQDAIELERQRLTLEQLLNLVIAIDDKLSGKDTDSLEPGLRVLIEGVVAAGDITGIEGDTSNEAVRQIFEKPMSVTIKNAAAKGSITGVKLEVSKELPIKKAVQIDTDFGQIIFNPKAGEITLGKGITKNE